MFVTLVIDDRDKNMSEYRRDDYIFILKGFSSHCCFSRLFGLQHGTPVRKVLVISQGPPIVDPSFH
jgi:hypothetical protein